MTSGARGAPSADRSDHPLGLAIAATGFPLVIGMYRGFALPMNHDVGWLLHLSDRVLDGARLYVDLIEVNPPLIVWLGMPVLLLERMTGVSHTLLFPLLVAIGATASLVVCWRLSRAVVRDPYRVPLLGALAVALFVVPSGDWGQREHLAIIMTAPYLLACAARARGLDLGTGRAWILGFAAGVGFALKPHFLIVPLVLEAWLIRSRRSVATMGVVGAGTVVIYGAAVLLLAPEYLGLMTELGSVYSRYVTPPLWRVVVHTPSILVALAVPLAFVRGEGREARMAFGLACGAWWLVALVQGKGFFYHYLPGLGAAAVLFVLGFAAAGSRRGARIAVLAPLIFTLPVLVETVLRPRGGADRWERIAEVSAVAAGDSVLILSHSHRDSWPAVNYSQALWTSSLPSTWPARPEIGAGEYAARHSAQALSGRPVVLVTRRPNEDPLDALLEQPEFQRAWADYGLTDSLRHYRVFRSLPHREEDGTPTRPGPRPGSQLTPLPD